MCTCAPFSMIMNCPISNVIFQHLLYMRRRLDTCMYNYRVLEAGPNHIGGVDKWWPFRGARAGPPASLARSHHLLYLASFTPSGFLLIKWPSFFQQRCKNIFNFIFFEKNNITLLLSFALQMSQDFTLCI